MGFFLFFEPSLRGAPRANEPTNFRTAVRACSVLVPLFGLQWLLTFYRHLHLIFSYVNYVSEICTIYTALVLNMKL